MDRKLTLYILVGMVLGVIVGQVLNQTIDPAVIKESIAPWFKLLSDIFLNLIKMLVAPLVLSTIVVGIGRLGLGVSERGQHVRHAGGVVDVHLAAVGLDEQLFGQVRVSAGRVPFKWKRAAPQTLLVDE